MPDDSLKPVMILLPDRFADWETPLISGIGGDFYGLRVRHVTPGGGTIRSMGGLTVTGLEDAVPREDEVIVLCGGESWTGDAPPDLAEMLRAAHGRGQTVAGICAATLALGEKRKKKLKKIKKKKKKIKKKKQKKKKKTRKQKATK